jgi:hypothetical protein
MDAGALASWPLVEAHVIPLLPNEYLLRCLGDLAPLLLSLQGEGGVDDAQASVCTLQPPTSAAPPPPPPPP